MANPLLSRLGSAAWKVCLRVTDDKATYESEPQGGDGELPPRLLLSVSAGIAPPRALHAAHARRRR